MRILIAEDDLVSRKVLLKFLSPYGECDVTVDGLEALDAFLIALKEKKPYDLACIDIMMPKIDGLQVVRTIRKLEKEYSLQAVQRTKLIMVTALSEAEYVEQAFSLGCEAYAAKPLDTVKLAQVMEKLDLI